MAKVKQSPKVTHKPVKMWAVTFPHTSRGWILFDTRKEAWEWNRGRKSFITVPVLVQRVK